MSPRRVPVGRRVLPWFLRRGPRRLSVSTAVTDARPARAWSDGCEWVNPASCGADAVTGSGRERLRADGDCAVVRGGALRREARCSGAFRGAWMNASKLAATATACAALVSTSLVVGPAHAASERVMTPLGEVILEVPDSKWTQDYGCQDVPTHFDIAGAPPRTEWEATASVDVTGPRERSTSFLGGPDSLRVCPTSKKTHRVRFDVELVNGVTGIKVDAWVETTFTMRKMKTTTAVLFANRWKKAIAVVVRNDAGAHPGTGVVRIQKKKKKKKGGTRCALWPRRPCPATRWLPSSRCAMSSW